MERGTDLTGTFMNHWGLLSNSLCRSIGICSLATLKWEPFLQFIIATEVKHTIGLTIIKSAESFVTSLIISFYTFGNYYNNKYEHCCL